MTLAPTGRLRGIAVRSAKRANMRVTEVSAIHRSAGVDGDFGRKPGRAQVTVLSEESWSAACGEVGAALPWTTRRANLLVSGIPLKPMVGSRIVIGAVVLEVTDETAPCSRMEAAHAGLRRALVPDARGGVRCRVISGGPIAVGDAVLWQPAMADLFAGDFGSGDRRAAGA